MHIIGIVAALTSAASWALGSILFKKIGEKISPFGMTLAKGFIGIVLLGLVYSVYGLKYVPIGIVIVLFISGIVGIAIGDTLFFASLQYLGPKVQIIFFMMGQVMTAILSLMILKEMPALLQWVGILVTLFGVLVVIWQKIAGGSENKKTGMRGITLGFLAMFCFSASLIIAKHAMISISTLGAAFIRITGGTLGMLFYGLLTRQVGDWLNPLRDLKMIVFFFFSVCVVMFGGFWLSLVALKYLNVAIASTLGATEPLFILPLALFFLKERITLVEVVGAFLTICGVAIIIIGSI